MKGQTSICILLGVLVLIGLIAWFCSQQKAEPMVEGFYTSGGLDNVGSLDNSVDLLSAPDYNAPSDDFADLVDSGDHIDVLQQPKTPGDASGPMERLNRTHGQALMPRVSKNVTPFNVDVANPSTYSYMVNAGRVASVKSRFADYSMSNFIRGDVPIRYHPNIPLIGKTVQDRDSWRGDGLFSPGFHALYNKLTGKAFKNLPVQVAGAGTAACYGGASGGVIMS